MYFGVFSFGGLYAAFQKCFIPRREMRSISSGVQLFLLMFYPPKATKGVPLFLLIFYFGLGNVYGTFVSDPVIRLFEILKMFYPPKGLCESRTRMGSIWRLSILMCLRKGVFFTFNLRVEIYHFQIMKIFYHPKGLCESRTQWGPFDAFPFYCVCERVFDSFNLLTEFRLFEILKMFCPRIGIGERWAIKKY